MQAIRVDLPAKIAFKMQRLRDAPLEKALKQYQDKEKKFKNLCIGIHPCSLEKNTLFL